MYNLDFLYHLITNYTPNIFKPITNFYNYFINLYNENDLRYNNNVLKFIIFFSLIVNLMQYLNTQSDREKIKYLENTNYKLINYNKHK